MIIYKWTTDYLVKGIVIIDNKPVEASNTAHAPSLITSLIEMFLGYGSVQSDPVYNKDL